MMTCSDWKSEAVARAALSMGETLLLALTESGMLDRDEVHQPLEGAANAHQQAADSIEEPTVHRAAQRMMYHVVDGFHPYPVQAAHDMSLNIIRSSSSVSLLLLQLYLLVCSLPSRANS